MTKKSEMGKNIRLVHIEYPMFKRKMLCGVKFEGLKYVWPIDDDAFTCVSCVNCRKLWRTKTKRRGAKTAITSQENHL